MIYIAIASITPRLERCALHAIERTTPEPHRVIVVRGRPHGAALDFAFSNLPSDATYFVTMDDDAAPLKRGWLSWMLKQMGWLDYLTFGQNMVVGAVYCVPALRDAWKIPYMMGSDIAGKAFSVTTNPGDAFRDALTGAYVPRDRGPWWLTNCEAYRDGEGELVFAHLGGGTIGHTWRYQGKLYPRIPTWMWTFMVRRHLRRYVGPV